MGSKTVKMEEEKDRISALPDSIIHHILSFLPSTKKAIQTSVLSKQWQNHWTHVPVLIFDLSGMRYRSVQDICRIFKFLDNTLILHDCSKIKKFHIKSFWNNSIPDSNYNVKLLFAIRKEVEELVLTMYSENDYKLPNFFFNNASLIKLDLLSFTLIPNGRVNWERLKDLCLMSCLWSTQAIESILGGTPLLESLEIKYCSGFDRLAIASKSLKRLVLALLHSGEVLVLEIYCPNLVEFSASDWWYDFSLSDREIKNVLSVSTSLQLLELIRCKEFKQLVIDSNSLKKLLLVDVDADAIVISCPNLKELHLCSLNIKTIELINMTPSICVTLDFDCYSGMNNENLGRMMLEQLRHVKELNFGRCFLKTLSALEMEGVSSPLINSKCLTFDGVENLPGIAYALRSSPELEKLVITLRGIECETPHDFPDLNVSGENYWNSKGDAFDCLVSHVKIVKIYGLSDNDDLQLKLALNFVEYLLKNAKVLERMVVIVEDNHGAAFMFKVPQKLLSFSRSSPYAVVELLCSKSPEVSKYASHSF
ncbi:putative F-box/LRR-repeat protein At3g18150 [Euphorbia lathyris]|uniref:putative F-box/LRR-repeat protein At3g18150 n=1 Tax=Euphorbia lathyris TaxID=212925 RepID=UPI003313C1BA